MNVLAFLGAYAAGLLTYRMLARILVKARDALVVKLNAITNSNPPSQQ